MVPMAKCSIENPEVRDLLQRFNTAEAGAAWVEFIDQYSRIILAVVRQVEFEHDRSDECFLFVCEKLIENGFRRLLKFNPSGKAEFSTWLSAVVFNLSVDWHRHEYGRIRMLPAISALAEFDQAVYRMVHEQGMDREAVFQRLLSDFPDLERTSIARSLERIHNILTPRQRWRMSLQSGRRRAESRVLEKVENLPSPVSSPEAVFQKEEQSEVLEQSLARLTQEQRLLVYWRYQEGLTLKRIAILSDLGSTNRVWTEIQKILAMLFDDAERIEQENSKKI